MRYIADSNGYLKEVSFGAIIECDGKTCVEYTGSVPSGYGSLDEWFIAECERLYMWKIIGGKLTFDSAAPKPIEEWTHPPMLIGEEYRTADRWNGKVVYTKLVDLGALGGAMTYKQVSHGIACTKFVGAEGYAITNDQYLRLLSTNDNADGNGDNYLYIMPSAVFIQVGITSLAGYNAYVTLRYIKD